MSIQKQLVPILIPDLCQWRKDTLQLVRSLWVMDLSVQIEYTYLTFSCFSMYYRNPKLPRINIASPLDSFQVRDSSERGFNTFLFKNNDNGTFTVMWTVSSQQGKGNGRTGKSGNGSNTYGTHDILQSIFNINGKAMTITLR